MRTWIRVLAVNYRTGERILRHFALSNVRLANAWEREMRARGFAVRT